jgi:hypothetical protein
MCSAIWIIFHDPVFWIRSAFRPGLKSLFFGTCKGIKKTPRAFHRTSCSYIQRLQSDNHETSTQRVFNHFLLFPLNAHNMSNTYIYHQLPPTWYIIFWVFPRRLNIKSRRFGTLCRFHLHRWLGVNENYDTSYMVYYLLNISPASEY